MSALHINPGRRSLLVGTSFSLLATAAALGIDVVTPYDRPPDAPKAPREKTPADLERIEAAQRKRDRKAARKAQEAAP